MWNDIQLTDAEKSVLEAVRLIAPNVERISVRSEQSELRKPIPIIRIKGQDEPLPLRVLGDGINRIFGLTLALINAKGGMLLIDEIENGIHYSVFNHFWRFIFTRQLNLMYKFSQQHTALIVFVLFRKQPKRIQRKEF